MARPILLAQTSAVSAAGVPALFAGLLVIEAGIPLPIPGDVLMLLVGERAAAHALPLWLAALGLEAVVALGTAALFYAARGPARAFIRRDGRHVGLTPERLDHATRLLEHRGRAAVAVGRATPSLRTITVIAVALSNISAAVALPLLLLGGSLFVQLHLVLGYTLGPVAEDAFRRAQLPVLVAVVGLALAAAAYWLLRHGRRGAHSWSEATCPACVALHAVPVRMRVDPHELATAP